MSVIRRSSLDKETILDIYRKGGVIEVINTYHNAEILIICDDFADEIDSLIDDENNSLLDELKSKIEKEL